MKKVKSENENPIIPGRVTTDAVYRRLNAKKDNKNKTNASDDGQFEESDCYFCEDCNKELPVSVEDLKCHFESVKHNQFSSCVYCSNPVYVYKYKKKQEVYHICRYS